MEQKDNSHQVLRHLATHLDTHLKSRVGKKIIKYDLPFQYPIGNALALPLIGKNPDHASPQYGNSPMKGVKWLEKSQRSL